MTKICVIGSINLDMFTTAPTFPEKGETILGQSFFTQPGGKGANQAIAAAKLGGDVSFIGAVGQDEASKTLLENFAAYNVDTTGVASVETHSGMAQITIAQQDNTIIVVPGANMDVTVERVKEHLAVIDACDLVMLQMEIPIETVEYVIAYAHAQNKTIVLNPAPAHVLSAEAIEKSTYITPNEVEIKTIFGPHPFEEVLARYPNKVIMTKGSDGVYFHNGTEQVWVQAEKTTPVDTTGAGDTFNGAFAVGISEGQAIEDAVRFANKAAAIAITKMGAQVAMPTREELTNG